VGVAATQGLIVAVTANGDTYDMAPCCTNYVWTLRSNVFGGPTPATRESFGALKARYRGAPGAAQPAPQDR
jgi:hypothetical protein